MIPASLPMPAPVPQVPAAPAAAADFALLLSPAAAPVMPAVPLMAGDRPLPFGTESPEAEEAEPIGAAPPVPPILAMLIAPGLAPAAQAHHAPIAAQDGQVGQPVAAAQPLPLADPAPAAEPALREAPSSTPPIEAVDAPALDLSAAPDQMAAQPAPAAQAGRAATGEPRLDATDPRWIARMADEIARTAADDGRARFRLNPETLGTIEVSVRHTGEGVAIRFEVESEATRSLLANAEHRLAAEARAAGLRIAETHIDLSSGQHQQHARQDARDRPQPLVALRLSPDTPTTDEPARDDAAARYA